jgi:hypothetical protein
MSDDGRILKVTIGLTTSRFYPFVFHSFSIDMF